jgi:transposase
MDLETITELLNIPNYSVTRILQMNSESLHMLVEPIDPETPICSGCGSSHSGPVHSMGSMTVQDLQISGRRVFLQVPKRKVLCEKDKKIRVETLNWISGRFTKRFADGILRLTTVTSYRGAGWYLEVDDETIHRMDRRKKPESSSSPARKG